MISVGAPNINLTMTTDKHHQRYKKGWNYLRANSTIYPSPSYCRDTKHWLTTWVLVAAIRTWVLIFNT